MATGLLTRPCRRGRTNQGVCSTGVANRARVPSVFPMKSGGQAPTV